jgi:hypothetical protein
MRFDTAVLTRTVVTTNDSAALIDEWADLVMNLWDESRELDAVDAQPSQHLHDACLVRDQLHNRLHVTHPESGACAELSLQLLSSADRLFRQFTAESTSAGDLSAHNHYPHRAAWWWGRLPRTHDAVVSYSASGALQNA